MSLVILNAGECDTYRCPGDAKGISRAVHLSRMAAFYPACRDCEHRHDVGALSRRQVAKLEDLAQRRTPRDVFQRDGVRGVHLNDLTREWGIRFAEGIAGELWRQCSWRSRAESVEDGNNAPTWRPLVVIANDGRAASWDVGTGIVVGLRRGGCDVVDAGTLSGPATDFAVHHLRADAGLRMTGAGCPTSWCGVDVIDGQGVPWSLGGRLSTLRSGMDQPVNRRTRRGGDWSHCDIRAAHQAMLSRFLHRLGGVRAGLADEVTSDFHNLPNLSAETQPLIVPVEAPEEFRSNESAGRAGQREWRQRLRDLGLAFGFVRSADGRGGELIDERGRLIPADEWLVRLAEFCVSRERNARLVVSSDVSGVCRGRLKAIGADVIQTGDSWESVVSTFRESQALLGTDGQGRIWFRDDYPICDPVVTLLSILRALTESGQPASQWAK